MFTVAEWIFIHREQQCCWLLLSSVRCADCLQRRWDSEACLIARLLPGLSPLLLPPLLLLRFFDPCCSTFAQLGVQQLALGLRLFSTWLLLSLTSTCHGHSW
jgi:hypothetical protein